MRLFVATVLLLSVSLSSAVTCFAQDKPTVSQNVVGGTFKLLAKTFVAASNLEKLKKVNIQRLRKMSDEYFAMRYRDAYHEAVENMPQELQDRYGVSPRTTRSDAIKIVGMVKNKSELYEIIDAVPNNVIARHFIYYLKIQKDQIESSEVVEKAKEFSRDTIEKFSPPHKRPPQAQSN